MKRAYLLDPFAGHSQNASFGAILSAYAMGLLLLPTWPLPNRWLDTHTLNGASWTLLQEYLANLAYALFVRKLATRTIGILAILSGVVLFACGVGIGTLDRGYAWDNLWMAPVRLCFPFLTGLWLYRVKERLPRVGIGYLPLTLILVIAFAAPRLPTAGGVAWNGVYEALCVLLLFPCIVVAGAHSNAGHGMARLCKVSGRLSYPLYITHFPFLYIWGNFVANEPASTATLVATAIALVPFELLVACASYVLWDVPIRSHLRRRTA